MIYTENILGHLCGSQWFSVLAEGRKCVINPQSYDVRNGKQSENKDI